MFTVELYTNRAYRSQGKVGSLGRAAVLMHRLRTPGKVRIKNAKGHVVCTGRIVQTDNGFEFKPE